MAVPARDPLDAFLASVERRALRMAEIATRDREQALDLVQDAMFQLARSYAGHPPAEWPPLFYRCLQNRIVDWQRRQSVWRRLFFRDDRPPADCDDAAPVTDVADPSVEQGDERIQREQRLARIEQALRRLPQRQRQAFELRVWEELDVRDTARAMACSEGSVKTHLSRAVASLRTELKEVWP